MDSEGLILLIWIASIPESRTVQHLLLDSSQKNIISLAALYRVKNPLKSRNVSFYKRELRPLNG